MGSPFWGFGEKVDRVQRIVVKILSVVLEEMPINARGASHHLSHDKDYLIHEVCASTKK